jgi:DNA-binding MarR family transcriptional regulator
VSCQDNLYTPEIGSVPRELPLDDDQLQLALRLGLDEVAAAEEERLRRAPRRRPTQSQLHRLAYNLYRARRSRSRLFDPQLFGEPAWDMLLALYSLPPRGEVLGVSSLSLAAEVPGTTGLRWQDKLIDEGLIKRGPHVRDARVQLVGLSQLGRLLMDRYLVRLFYCQGGLLDVRG